MVYTNAWSKLEPGRCRYGMMLGEDGMVMDDGVTSRLADNHFHMTTTTGGAARVMAWLEDWLQCEWTDKKVYLTSVTEQWAVIGISGPLARKLLAEVAPTMALDDQSFPHSPFTDGIVAGVKCHVYRITFTGEATYEINMPPSYAMHVWRALMQAGEKYGITPYGTEAMHVLRAEKGFVIVGQETDGTTTPQDLGMDWIVSKQKPDFLRQTLAAALRHQAAGPQAPGRPADRGSERSAAGRRADRRGAEGQAADGNDRPRDVELLQPELRPLDRHGAGQERPQPDGRDALHAV